MKPCKYMSDDGQEICCNADCAAVADFCPLANYPTICRHYQPKEDEA